MTLRRTLALGGLMSVALVMAWTGPAHAGGSAWWPDKRSYSPGEVAVASGNFGAGCCDRGWVDDGPYRVWIVPYGDHSLTGLVLPEGAIPVGDLRVEQRHDEWTGRPTSQWVASVEFVVPDVAPGPYLLVHCTDPCGTGLGDLMYAFFWVGPAPDFPPPTPAPPSPVASATAPRSSTSATSSTPTASTWWVPVGAAAVGVGAVAGGAVGLRRLRRR